MFIDIKYVHVSFLPRVIEAVEQFAVNPAETAVAENTDHVTALGFPGNVRDNGIGVRQVRRSLAGAFQIVH